MFNANGIVGPTESTLVGYFTLESPFRGARGALILLVELGTACNGADRIYGFREGDGCDACDARGGC